MKIGFAHNEYRWSDVQLKRVAALLPADLYVRSERFWQWTDQQAYLIGKLLLSSLLGKQPKHLDLLYTSNGRPHIKGVNDFNISHSGALVICIVSGQGRIGIDVEKRERININEFRTVFTSEEWTALQEEGHCAVKTFYDYWTIKEAVLKAKGTGLLLPPDKVKLMGNRAMVNDESWIIKHVPLPGPYCCHLAMEIPQPLSEAIDLTAEIRKYIMPHNEMYFIP